MLDRLHVQRSIAQAGSPGAFEDIFHQGWNPRFVIALFATCRLLGLATPREGAIQLGLTRE